MFRVVLLIEYDGTNYHGWQIQKNSELITIQQQVESAIAKVANHPVTTICAGRTDAGVHAKGQVVHFDTTTKRTIVNWIFGINNYLPKDIRVLNAQNTTLTFDARKSAIYRTYTYIIYNSKIKPGLFSNYLSWEYKKLDIELMQQVANVWLGEHDFSSFRGKDCQSKSAIRKIYNIACYRQKKLIIISITANAFLKHMVRNMVGTLIKLSVINKLNNSSKLIIQSAQEILTAKDRTAAGATAPPEGLYLVEVGYPIKFNLFINSMIDR